MALVWKEQYFDRGVSDSSSGVGRTRGWIVSGDSASPDVVAADTNPAAPYFGKVHEDYPRLVVNNVSYLPQGRHTVVRASYVPEEFQDPIPPELDTGLDFFKIDTTFEDVDVDIPVFQLVTMKTTDAAGGVISQDVWKPVSQKATFRYARIVHRVTLNATIAGGAGIVTQLGISQAITEETNKIHQIGGVKYLFKSDSVRRTKIDEYQFTYRWISDPGIPNTLNFDMMASPNIALIGSYGFPVANLNDFPHPNNLNGYVIPPFHRLDTAPDRTDPTNVPVVTISPSYIENLNGYLDLPGAS